MHFYPDKRLPIKEAISQVNKEVLEYRNSLDENQMIYDEAYNDDGSVILYVRKKVKDIPVGSYFTRELL